MNPERLKMLRQFVEEDPADAFNWYALALEYRDSDPAQASQLFDKLVNEFGDYLPAYYMAATHCAQQGDAEKAARIFHKGIEVAQEQGDLKTAAELRSGLAEILFE